MSEQDSTSPARPYYIRVGSLRSGLSITIPGSPGEGTLPREATIARVSALDPSGKPYHFRRELGFTDGTIGHLCIGDAPVQLTSEAGRDMAEVYVKNLEAGDGITLGWMKAIVTSVVAYDGDPNRYLLSYTDPDGVERSAPMHQSALFMIDPAE